MADQELEMADDNPTPENLLKLTDDELYDLFGLKEQLKKAKEALQKMTTLTGKGRKHAEERLKEMFTPNIYPNEFKYILESAERKNMTVAEKKADCSPCSVLD